MRGSPLIATEDLLHGLSPLFSSLRISGTVVDRSGLRDPQVLENGRHPLLLFALKEARQPRIQLVVLLLHGGVCITQGLGAIQFVVVAQAVAVVLVETPVGHETLP